MLLALVIRALMSPRARGSIDATFATGVVVWLVADTGPLALDYEGVVALAIETGWMVAPVLLAGLPGASEHRSTPSTAPRATAGGPRS